MRLEYISDGDLSKDVPGVFDLDRHDPKAVTPECHQLHMHVAYAIGNIFWAS